jgi:hypothetical protein
LLASLVVAAPGGPLGCVTTPAFALAQKVFSFFQERAPEFFSFVLRPAVTASTAVKTAWAFRKCSLLRSYNIGGSGSPFLLCRSHSGYPRGAHEAREVPAFFRVAPRSLNGSPEEGTISACESLEIFWLYGSAGSGDPPQAARIPVTRTVEPEGFFFSAAPLYLSSVRFLSALAFLRGAQPSSVFLRWLTRNFSPSNSLFLVLVVQ